MNLVARIAALRHRPWWPWLKRILGFAFLAVVVFLLVRYARGVNWSEVKRSLLELPRSVLMPAFVMAGVAHLVYSLLDLVGRHYTGHSLSPLKVMQVSLVSYAFNLNLGSIVGGIGFRYRLYSRLGLRPGEITRIVTLSMITNWLGYILLAGLVFTFAPLALPPNWKIDSGGLRVLGAILLAAIAAYLCFTAWTRTRTYEVRGHEIVIPSFRVALVQLAISCTHWLAMAAIPWLLLQGEVNYPTALSVLLIAAIAGVITHVPAGLGVVEAVFIALLSHRIPEHQLLGALLAYRALFYILPLLGGGLLYLATELQARKTVPAA